MAKAKGINLFATQSTAGGTNLGQHWRGEKNLQTKELVNTQSYDMVILQDHSLRAIDHPDSLNYYVKLWSDLIRSKGGEVYLYMTWSRKWDPYMISTISKEYENIGKEIKSIVVPVGLAWKRARELRPELDLYDPDGSHPSTIGTYLTACVFLEFLSGENPIGLPYRLIDEDKFGQKLYLNILSPEDALFCQKVAHEIYSIDNN
ncbi:DUF4886 domain-containing protein [Portibacter marinus]|uniref:DUF4886 domain-containing protein n=1 Tax=Portibacter marinus TaxID=2898660 RepID=UPI001F3EE725|nr:DUF4886 domain-containing protein [Portibacter marinus]